RGGLDLSSPSELLKVNYLVMKHLHFESVRGDLQERHGCFSRCQFGFFSYLLFVVNEEKKSPLK
ncbi:MAG: hypothetical protein PUI10_02155, partial [Prevotellaceae bacterium]|nr:hypothetical protein [Prevotellaceae bacterium]